MKTISLSHHGAEKHDNPLSSHVDTFKGSFNSSVPQSVVTRPKGPHQVGKSRRAASNFPTPRLRVDMKPHETIHPSNPGMLQLITHHRLLKISILPSPTSFTDSQHEHPPILPFLLHTQSQRRPTPLSAVSNQFLWHRS